MKPSELFDNCRNELSEKAVKVIVFSDQFLDEIGDFKSAAEFNQFVEENFTDEDFNN